MVPAGSAPAVRSTGNPRLHIDRNMPGRKLLKAERTYDSSHPAYDATAVRNYPGRIFNSTFGSKNVAYAHVKGYASADLVADEVWTPVLEAMLEEVCAIAHANEVFDGIAYIEDYAEALERKYEGKYYPGWVNIDDALFLYWLVRLTNPHIIVQTGVSNGLSAAMMVLALVKNADHGKLHAIDLPRVFDGTQPSWTQKNHIYEAFIPEGKSSGWLVPEAYRHHVKLWEGDAKNLLPELLGELESVDMFFHDSDHSYNHMMFEFNQIKRRIVTSGLVAADDISWNSSLWDFADQEMLPAYNFKGSVGVAFL